MIENFLKNEVDKKNFEKYASVRGKYVFNQINSILETSNVQTYKYKDIESVIRYDKNLRSKLYIYLATFEEYFKFQLFSKLCYNDNSLINDSNFENKNRFIEKQANDGESLYYNSKLSLGKLIKLDEIHVLNIFSPIDLKNIRNLRNKVMHHFLLIFGKEKKLENVIRNLEKIKKEIISLRNCLPVDYQKGFTRDINKIKINNKINNLKNLI